MKVRGYEGISFSSVQKPRAGNKLFFKKNAEYANP